MEVWVTQIPSHMTIKRSHCSGNERTSSSSEQSEKPTSDEDVNILVCVFMIPISIISIITYYTLCSGSPAPQMGITFENEADELLRTFAKVLVTFEERQYLLAAQCIWWIAALIQLDSALRYSFDNRKFCSELRIHSDNQGWAILEREIATTPRDIQWLSVSDHCEEPAIIERKISLIPRDIQWLSMSVKYVVLTQTRCQADPLWCTGKGRIEHLPKTKKQLKAARKRLLKIETRKYSIDRVICIASIF